MSKTYLLTAVAAVLLGCGSGSPPDPAGEVPPPPGPPPADTVAPTGRILYPPRLSMTDGATLTVTGIASDDRAVAAVRVNGVAASSSDSYATWRAVVPLLFGTNRLSLEITDPSGNVRSPADAVEVERFSPLWAAPSALAVDPATNTAYVVDGTLDRVFVVDLASGARSPMAPGGSSILSPTAAAIAGNRLLVLDSLLATLFVVDRTTGTRSVLAQGAPFATPAAMVMDTLAGRALVVDPGAGTLFAVDLSTGARTALRSDFAAPRGVAFDPGSNRAVVSDDAGLHFVDLSSNSRALVAGTSGTPSGELVLDRGRALVIDRSAVVSVDLSGAGESPFATGFVLPRHLAIDGSRLLVIDPGADALFAADLATGQLSTVSGTSFGAGPIFVNPRGVALDLVNRRAFVVDFTVGLLCVDLQTGDRSLVDGGGADFGVPIGCAYDNRFNRVLVADTGRRAILGVDASTGFRTIISDSDTGSGTELDAPVGLVFDRTNNLVFVVDSTLRALVAVDLANGNRAVLSSHTVRGLGPPFQVPRAIAQDVAGDRFLVADAGIGTVLSVNLFSGDRAALAAPGPATSALAGIILDLARNRVVLTDTALDSITGVDLQTGASTPLDGSGPQLVSPDGIAFDPVSGLLSVIDSGLGALLVVEPVSGDRVVLSK